MSKKIKILYTIPNFDTAGSGKVLYDLAKGLDKDLFDVSIACNNSNGFFFQEIKNLGLPIYIEPTTKPLYPYYNLIFRIKPIVSFIKKHQFDIVHSWHWSSDWTEVLACRIAGAKFIYTKKAMSWGNAHWKIKSFLTNFIITINEEMSNFFKYKKNQKLIPLGIDTNFYSPKLFDKIDNDNFFKIITVANLVSVKGIEVLIKAINLINNPKIKLEILGKNGIEILEDGSEYDYYAVLQQLVSDLNLENQVVFLGMQSDVRPFLSNADLYVIPTLNKGRKEGMPMALVEAMAMGIPVLGSDITGINYVLKDFPEFLFEASNEKALSEKIKFFLQKGDKDLNDIGNQLRSYCLDNFSDDKFIKQHECLYLNLIKKG